MLIPDPEERITWKELFNLEFKKEAILKVKHETNISIKEAHL